MPKKTVAEGELIQGGGSALFIFMGFLEQKASQLFLAQWPGGVNGFVSPKRERENEISEITLTKRMFAILFSQPLANSFHFTHTLCVCPDVVDTLTVC